MNNHRGDILAEIERRRRALGMDLLQVYNFYRVLVSLGLIAAVQQSLLKTELGVLDPTLFTGTAIAYAVTNVVVIVFTRLTPAAWQSRQSIVFAWIASDLLWLSLLMFASGGIGSGLAALILVTVVAGAILITGRLATLLPAIASLALLYEEFYLALAQPGVSHDFLQAGVFGAIYFAASLGIQRLSGRLRDKDIRALTQAVELADLERLNRQIIQRMQTGIVVVDHHDGVRLHNQSARALLGTGDALQALPDPLRSALHAWRADHSTRHAPFRVSADAPEIRCNFSSVRSDDAQTDITIFLEDTGEVQQQAQQLKMAELGRLSASIAHEVRNPLGAISHAAQLLGESDDLNAADTRLTEIIVAHCQRMNGVVENVLEMSRRKSPVPQRLVLDSYLREFRDAFRQARPEAQFSIEIEPAQTEVRVDPRHLGQALTNLADNALRYSDSNQQGHRVLLSGGMDAATERPFLNVIDFGVGVAAEQEVHLFQPFSTTSSDGTGLGLYLSRELCEANQAQLSYSRHADGGSCFRILFAHPDKIIA